MVKKIVIVGHDNYGAREIFENIVNTHSELEFLLIITTGLYYKKTFFNSVVKMLKEASIPFCFNRFIELAKYKIKGDTLYSRANKRNISVFFTDDINGDHAIGMIKKFSPDLIISTFTMHVFKQQTINMSRIATIGCHPSILPHYRGLEVFFWALANRETSSGVSVFYLSEKIDQGQVILQEKFEITDTETVESIYMKLTEVAGRLLSDAVKKIIRNESFPEIFSHDKGSYYPMPTHIAYKKFKASGRKWR